MIETGRYCIDVAHQVDAVIAALRRVQSDMLRDHLRACTEAALGDGLAAAERGRMVDEVATLLARRK